MTEGLAGPGQGGTRMLPPGHARNALSFGTKERARHCHRSRPPIPPPRARPASRAQL